MAVNPPASASHLRRGGGKRDRLPLEIGEEEQFVFDYRPAKGGAVTVAVKTGIGREALQHEGYPPRSGCDS